MKLYLFYRDPTRHWSPDDPNHAILYAIIIFLILTGGVNLADKKKSFKVSPD
jgi:hypothetical protein